MDVSEGTVVAGRYRLAERLGGGGMGEVWKARDQRLHVEVAAKRLVLDPYATPEERRTALAYAVTESRHAAALRTHPNVVAVHDVVEDEDGMPWTVMDLVSGRSLAQALTAGERLGPDRAALIGLQVLSALAAAHAIGIVHRDVKPGNIMLADDGRILLVDFGIARHHEDTRITRTGMAVGTVEYMAPERFDGADGPAGDLWALGVTLYEAVGGGSPFRRESMMATIRAIGMDDPPPPASGGRLAGPILRLLDKDPRSRPTTDQAAALLEGDRASGTVPLARAGGHPPTQPVTAGPLSAARPPLTATQEELYDRAVRIAESIDDPEERAAAFVAVGLAAPWLGDEITTRVAVEDRAPTLMALACRTDDAGLARRLLERAEAIVAPTTAADQDVTRDWSSVHALSKAAGLLAGADPGFARQLMGRVESAARDLRPDPDYVFALPEQLVEIAKDGHDADPHASRRLINLAEQRALDLAEQEDRNLALQLVGEAVAPVDPDRAERLIGMITERHVQVSAWEHAVEAAITADSRHVPHLIDTAELALVGPAPTAGPAPVATPVDAAASPLRDEEQPSGGWWRRKTRRAHPADADVEVREREAPADADAAGDLVGIAVAAAAADVPRAERLAARITHQAARTTALTGMARQVAASRPDQARSWLVAAHRSALLVPSAHGRRTKALGEVAAAASDIDPELAVRITERLLPDLGDREQVWTLALLAEHIAAVDPAQAIRLVDRVEGHRDTRTRPLDGVQRHALAEALAIAAATLVDTDPQQAKSLIRRARRTVHQPSAVEEYVDQTWWPLKALAGRNLHAAEQLIDQLPHSDQDPLLVDIVSTLAATDPFRAEQTAHRITDDTLRKRALVGVTLSMAVGARVTRQH
ncbi:serine/threonine-protein kinase [Kitasatospora sp. NPDC002965]|uniref:serine/threonine-protein kinase n=1 Tax=Kitasatospora sp. NPDC002965 TaxID=3154775 RepID=UPI0033A76F90